MSKNIPVEDVKTPREIIEPLTPPEGPEDPILIHDDGTLIDGLRRLRWAQSQGRKTIKAEVATEFLVAIENLKRARRGTIMPMRRVYEIHKELKDLHRAHNRATMLEVNRNRRKPGYVRKTDVSPTRSTDIGRALYIQATGESQFQATIKLYKLAEEDPNSEFAKRIRLYDEGKISKTRTLAAVKKGHPNSLSGPVRKASEQLQLIKGAAMTLHSVALAIRNLGEPILANPDDFAEAIEDLRVSRARITTFIHILEKTRNNDD